MRKIPYPGNEQWEVMFLSRDRPPSQQPNPNYPDGIELDTGERPACKLDLPYPAPCVGVWVAKCNTCGTTIGATAAGRPDDPKSIMATCKRSVN